MMDAKVLTTGEWVERKRNHPHGKLTQDCIRGMVKTGCVSKDNEYIKSGRTTLAGSRSAMAKASSSSKTKKFLKIQHGTDARLDRKGPPAYATVGKGKGTGVYRAGQAIDTDGTGLASRIASRS